MLEESDLRRQLREWIVEEYGIDEIAEFEDDTDEAGIPRSHRESLRWRYNSRLAGLRRVAPDRSDLHDQCLEVLAALNQTTDDERLFHWFARSSTRSYSGVSSAKRLIEFISCSLSSDDLGAQT